jgi:UDP-N-acetylmuramyl pentapeptide phosphotransferase/UDP-N-acetylglucosamine-1-phosphate transferase
MSTLVVSFLVSLLTTFFVVRYRHLHEHISGDHDVKGIQKFHLFSVPRIGGIGIAFGLIIALIFRLTQNQDSSLLGLLLIASAIPAFAAGIAEDLTKKISISLRFYATAVSAVLAGYLLNAWLFKIDVPFVDVFLKNKHWLVIVVTCFAITGVANSFNIIDGYNGLSGMVGVIILTAILYVAFQVNDYPVMAAALAMLGSLLGFLVWNYPRGLIFLGDGGAYLIGFWIAELCILLTIRNQEVSAWFALLICAYPVFETIFSIYRRIILKKSHPGVPDSAHLHHLIYKRVIRWEVASPLAKDTLIRNSLTAPYLWGLCLVSVIPGVIFWRESFYLQVFSLFFCFLYVILYRMLVKFSTPKWMTLRFKR